MKYTISIDTGGTFTDGFFTCGNRAEVIKVETTPHDLTVCFQNCIQEGARRLGLASVQDLLTKTSIIRYSTTVGTNTLIQKSGPKLGVILSNGHLNDLYQDMSVQGPDDTSHSILSLVRDFMIMGINHGVDGSNNPIEPDEDEVRRCVKKLLNMGAQAIVVSLKGSIDHPEAERRIKDIINSDYPRHYLGSIPVLLASEISTRPDDHLRTNTAVINAYLHRDMMKYLYKADAFLMKYKYDKPLLIVHNSGGISRVAKTTAINTYNSGPAAGLMGTKYIGSIYGLNNIISTDVGGTSTDIGIVAEGAYEYNLNPLVEGIKINIPMINAKAIGGGGGSIARKMDEKRKIQVGPESMGAIPGPACYGLGGRYATVTDADLVLGYLNPNYFLGGRKKLDIKRSITAIEKDIAKPLGISTEEAALLIRDSMESNIREALKRELSSRGYSSSDFVLFSFGGCGAVHCCGYGRDFSRIMVFPFGAVFSAFGATTTNVIHFYERAISLILHDKKGKYLSDYSTINDTVKEMQFRAIRDMRGEGFRPDNITFVLELEMNYLSEQKDVRIVNSPYVFLTSERELKSVCEIFDRISNTKTGKKTKTSKNNKGIQLQGVRIGGIVDVKPFSIKTHKSVSKTPTKALKGTRDVIWDKSGTSKTKVYKLNMLKYGNRVIGPAIIEAEDATYVIPPRFKLTMDRFLNLVIEKT